MVDITKAILEQEDHFVVKSTDWDGYPFHSVLSGQPIVKWLGRYDTIAEALKAHPEAEVNGGVGSNSVAHLPDEDDYSTRTMHDTWEDGE